VGDPGRERVVRAIERLLVGGIGVTTLAVNEAAEAAELTVTQWRLLVVLERDGARIGELAARLRLSVPSASRLVRRLERRGLVSAERDEHDRRATVVRLTTTGRRVRDAVLRRREQLIGEALGDRLDGRDDAAVRVLDTIATALEPFG
jgi:DNA-binding MarR family transcriptional regulator